MEEEKKDQTIDPQLDLKQAMEENGFDPKSPDFNKEAMIQRFTELSLD
jgi:hypothetical protein